MGARPFGRPKKTPIIYLDSDLASDLRLGRADPGVDRFFFFFGMPYDPISYGKKGLGSCTTATLDS